jgi:hypothetical protein
VVDGVQLGPFGTAATDWPIVTYPWWLWLWRIWWNEDRQRNPKYSEKTRPSATLSTTNPTWPDPRSNPGRRGGKPGTNRLSYGAALTCMHLPETSSWRYRATEGKEGSRLNQNQSQGCSFRNCIWLEGPCGQIPQTPQTGVARGA